MRSWIQSAALASVATVVSSCSDRSIVNPLQPELPGARFSTVPSLPAVRPMIERVLRSMAM